MIKMLVNLFAKAGTFAVAALVALATIAVGCADIDRSLATTGAAADHDDGFMVRSFHLAGGTSAEDIEEAREAGWSLGELADEGELDVEAVEYLSLAEVGTPDTGSAGWNAAAKSTSYTCATGCTVTKAIAAGDYMEVAWRPKASSWSKVETKYYAGTKDSAVAANFAWSSPVNSWGWTFFTSWAMSGTTKSDTFWAGSDNPKFIAEFTNGAVTGTTSVGVNLKNILTASFSSSGTRYVQLTVTQK